MFANSVHVKRCWPISFRLGKKFEHPKLFVWTRRMQFWQPCLLMPVENSINWTYKRISRNELLNYLWSLIWVFFLIKSWSQKILTEGCIKRSFNLQYTATAFCSSQIKSWLWLVTENFLLPRPWEHCSGFLTFTLKHRWWSALLIMFIGGRFIFVFDIC